MQSHGFNAIEQHTAVNHDSTNYKLHIKLKQIYQVDFPFLYVVSHHAAFCFQDGLFNHCQSRESHGLGSR